MESRKQTFAPIISQPIRATHIEGLVRLLHDHTPNINNSKFLGLDYGSLIDFFNMLLVNHKVKTLCRFPTHFHHAMAGASNANLRHYSVV